MVAQVEAVAVAALRQGQAVGQVETAAVQVLRRGPAAVQIETAAVQVLLLRAAAISTRHGIGVVSRAQGVLADAPAGFWSLDEPSGATAADTSGGGNDLTWAGTYTRGTAPQRADGTGKSVQVTGSGYATTASGAPYASDSITVEAVINPSSPFLTRSIIDRDDRGSNRVFQFNQGATGLQFIWWNSSGTFGQLLSSSGFLTTGVRNHVAATYDGTTARLYVNGVEIANGAGNGPLSTNTSPPLTICADAGALHNSQDKFTGYIDEVAVFSRALPPSRIIEHANA